MDDVPARMTFDAHEEAGALAESLWGTRTGVEDGPLIAALERAYAAGMAEVHGERDYAEGIANDLAKACGLPPAFPAATASPPPGSEPRELGETVESFKRNSRAVVDHIKAYVEGGPEPTIRNEGAAAEAEPGTSAPTAGKALDGATPSLPRGDSILPDRIRTFVAAHENDGGAAWLRGKLRDSLLAMEMAAAIRPYPDPIYVEARALLAAAYEETASRCRVLIEAAKADGQR